LHNKAWRRILNTRQATSRHQSPQRAARARGRKGEPTAAVPPFPLTARSNCCLVA